MNYNIIKISLAPGISGFYDELTGVHLTLSRRECDIDKSSLNIIGILKAIKDGKILVVSGSLGSETIDYNFNYCNPTNLRLYSKYSEIQNKFQENKEKCTVEKENIEIEKILEESKNDVIQILDEIKEQIIEDTSSVVDTINAVEEKIIEKEEVPKKVQKKTTRTSKKKNNSKEVK